MYKNYLKIALRNLKRNKIYSILNILGLSVGIIVCILIFLYVQDEISFDKFYTQADQIYRIINRGTIRGKPVETPLVSGPWGPAMKEEFPEVLKAVRIKTPESRWTIRYGDKKFFEKGFYFADPAFLDVFDVDLVAGDLKTVLDAPYSLILTEAMAEKYFGEENPIGKILKADLWLNLNVTGVMKKHPSSSHMNYDFLVNFETLLKAKEPPGQLSYGNLSRWQNFRMMAYLLLEKTASPKTVNEKMPAFLKKHLGRMTMLPGVEFNPYLQKITDIHLTSHLEGEIGPNSNKSYLYIFAVVAIFILIIAVINFMNLTTARSANRAKEVGMRKVVGAARPQLINQFLSESFLMTFFASIIAVVSVLLLLPEYSSITGKIISANDVFQIKTVFFLIMVTLIVGLLAGSYPAFLLTSFSPMEVVNRKFKSGSLGGLLRKILVVVQFAISIFLIIGLYVISSQMNYLRNKSLGFDKEHVLAVPLSDFYVRTNYRVYKNALLDNKNVISVSGASSIPGGIFGMGLFWPTGKTIKDSLNVQMMAVDYDFIETFGINLLDGRDFSQLFSGDMEKALLLNEEAVKQFGFDTPLDQKLIPGRKPVIGIVKDYHFKSLHQHIEPFVLQLSNPYNFTWVFVKVRGEDISEILNLAEKEWLKINPNHPFEYTFLDEHYDMLYVSEKRLSRLFYFFTGVAIFIACLGLFGLSSFLAEQKTKEIGIRKVLGASTGNIINILITEFIVLVAIANLIAWPAAYYAMSQWLQNFAYRINIGLWAFVFSAALAIVIALSSVSFQSIKAAVANPAESLRYE